MKKQFKRVTGLLPVAAGVSAALLSGMAYAEETVQRGSTALASAVTSFPSVGHRPPRPNLTEWRVNPPRPTFPSDNDEMLSSRTVLTPGMAFGPRMQEIQSDTDTSYGGRDQHRNDSCDIYRVPASGPDIFIRNSPGCSDTSWNGYMGAAYVIQPDDIGHKIKFVFYNQTYSESTTPYGYKANPDISLPFIYVTPSKVTAVITGPVNELSAPKSISADDTVGGDVQFTVTDGKGSAVSGLKVTFHSTMPEARFPAGNVPEISPGVYSAKITGTKTGTTVVSVSIDGVAVQGVSKEVEITPGAWDVAQDEKTLFSVGTFTPGTCMPSNAVDNEWRRIFGAINVTPVDKHKNVVSDITVQAFIRNEAMKFSDGSEKTHLFNGWTSVGLKIVNGVNYIYYPKDPYFASQALCEAEYASQDKKLVDSQYFFRIDSTSKKQQIWKKTY